MTREQQLNAYLELLRRWNRSVNLVAAGDEAVLEERHLADSLALEGLLPVDAATVLDLGSGGGFPGIPLAVARPELAFTLLDAKTKAIAFLRTVRRELGLTNVHVLHARVEEYAPEPPPGLIVSRAAFPPPALLSLAERLLAPGGHVIVMYGAKLPTEHATAFELVAEQPRPEGRRNVVYRRL
jgi:16S rRNA (guanine527-N7)-methyltransferase